MNGDGVFNGQILVDKLAKLNSTQQSIETLSHWCIFHRNKAKQVVETWERQFHCAPRDQRISFLYLANDILQNSRRKGMEFVGEFWRVLPDALNDVIENGDEFGKKAAVRLVDIWEERKVFSPHGQTLKEYILGRNRNGKNISYKLKQPSGDMLEKLTSSYQLVCSGCDEDAIIGKCRTAILKVEKEFGSDFHLGNISSSGVADELHVQHGQMRECIEQLQAAESSRATLLSHLRQAVNEQESKIEQLRDQLQVFQVQYEQVGRLLSGQPLTPPLPDQDLDEVPPPPPPPPSTYSEAPPPPDFPPEPPASTVSDNTSEEQRAPPPPTSSANMLSYVLSSLASEGIIENPSDPNKRPRVENGNNNTGSSMPCFMPQPMLPPPLPPTLPLVPPPLPPAAAVAPPSQFGQAAGSMPLGPFSFGSPQMQPMPGFPMGVPPYSGPPSPYLFQGPDGGFMNQPPFTSGLPPISRQ